MEKIRPRIADFKNDLVFKYLLSNMKDVQCYYLLKLHHRRDCTYQNSRNYSLKL